MPRKETALAVLLGVFAFGIVASRSLFVEGEAAGSMTPGLHPTTEHPLEALGAGAVEREDFIPARPAVESQGTVAARPSSKKRTAARRSSSAKQAAGVIPKGYVYWKTVRAKVTAYDPSRVSCGKFADGKTSIGQNAWVMDGVATDPRAIPYGTYVVIPGVGAKQVDDTGSAMRRSWRRHRRFHVDLRMVYPYQANRWGVKHLDVKLYRKAR